MIGFDRPLKPEWIYKTLELYKAGLKLSELKEPFNNIAIELTGNEGKRKVRTVLFRYFLDVDGNGSARKLVNDYWLASLVNEKTLEELKPLFLFILLSKADVLQKITKLIALNYSEGNIIKTSYITEKNVDAYGDRDVVSRSVRSFLKTLNHFDILEENKNDYIWFKRLIIQPDIFPYIFKEYSRSLGESIQINIQNLLIDPIFCFFDLSQIEEAIKMYNGEYWHYVRSPGKSLVNMINK